MEVQNALQAPVRSGNSVGWFLFVYLRHSCSCTHGGKMTGLLYHPKFPQFSVGCDTEEMTTEIFSDDLYADIGMLLHSMQQGVVDKLFLHGYELLPILMDQTGGLVSDGDIFKTNHSSRPYQRLVNIVNNNFEF